MMLYVSGNAYWYFANKWGPVMFSCYTFYVINFEGMWHVFWWWTDDEDISQINNDSNQIFMLSDQGFWFAVCRNLHYCSTACNCFVITTYCSSHYSKKKSVACSNFHLDCYWKVFLQVLAASDLATIRCPGVPCWFALQSQRRVLMQEGHKPSVSKQGDRICCHVLLPHVVCLQEGAIWLCMCVCC